MKWNGLSSCIKEGEYILRAETNEIYFKIYSKLNHIPSSEEAPLPMDSPPAEFEDLETTFDTKTSSYPDPDRAGSVYVPNYQRNVQRLVVKLFLTISHSLIAARM